jgi:tetratricopeptide (TPR) repeat protein
MFLAMHNIPQKFLSKLRYRNRADLQAKRHFVLGAQLIAQARSPSNSRSTATSLAKQAEDEANKAISLDPKDAASHILKALSLDLQGFRTSALESINVALSPLAVKSLSASEKGDALFKRAELAMGMNRRGRVEPAIQDLTEAVKLNKDNAKAFCLLGECYEANKMIEEAKEAYEEALRLQPELASAKEKLDLLRS